jgi:hypothetical protein
MRFNEITGNRKNLLLTELSTENFDVLLKLQIEITLEWMVIDETRKTEEDNGLIAKQIFLKQRLLRGHKPHVEYIHKITKPNLKYINDRSKDERISIDKRVDTVKNVMDLINANREQCITMGNKRAERVMIPAFSTKETGNDKMLPTRKELLVLVNSTDVSSETFQKATFIDYIDGRYHIVFDNKNNFVEELYYYVLGTSRGIVYYFGDFVKFITSEAGGFSTFSDILKPSFKI